LYDYLKNREFALSEKIACRLINQICNVISYLHSKEILYMNLNIESILMTDDSKSTEIRLVLNENIKYINKENICREFTGPIVRNLYKSFFNFLLKF